MAFVKLADNYTDLIGYRQVCCRPPRGGRG